uniref:Ig-like domain-containing protein n=1 Tax=Pygocentrus nattereri TaxID=42514 RepID=A0AAR2IUM1_PYGNA
ESCELSVVYRASVVLGVERSVCCVLSVVYRASVVLGVERSVCCVLSVVYRASVVLGVERSVCCELSVVYRASVVLGVERSVCCELSVVYRASVVLGVERSVCCVLSVVYRASVVLGVERSVCCELSVVYRASVVLGVERSVCCVLSVVYRASVVLGVERSVCCELSVVYRASVVLGVERSVCCGLSVVYRASVVLGVERSVCCELSVVYRASVVLGVERSVCCGLSVVLLVRMLLTFYLLFIGLHVSEGCNLVNREQLLSITAHRGGSVLLPCYCPDLQTTPEQFSWKKDNTKTDRREEISSESGQYRDRVQLFNGHSPGNLSLLISHLTEEDGGVYWCAVKGAHLIIRLTLKEGPPTTTPTRAVVSVQTRPATSTTHSSQKPDEPLPYIPFALVTVIFLQFIVAVVYHTKRTQDPARVTYSTADGVVSLD